MSMACAAMSADAPLFECLTFELVSLCAWRNATQTAYEIYPNNQFCAVEDNRGATIAVPAGRRCIAGLVHQSGQTGWRDRLDTAGLLVLVGTRSHGGADRRGRVACHQTAMQSTHTGI